MKNRQENEGRHSVLSDFMYWLKYYWKNAPLVLWVTAAMIVFSPCISMISLYFPKVVLSQVERQVPLQTLLLVVGGYTLLFVLVKGINTAMSRYISYIMSIESQRLVFQLFLKSLRLKYSYVESEEGKNAYYKANIQCANSAPSDQMLNTVQNTAVSILTFALYSTVLSTLSIWVVVILILLSGVGYLVKMRDVHFWNRIRGERAVNQKHYYYVKSAMGNVSAAKDIRIFNMGGWLRGRMEAVLADIRKLTKRQCLWTWHISGLNSLIGVVRDIGAYAYLLYMAVSGGMSVSDFFLYFSAISGFSGFVGGIVSSAGELRRCADDTDCVRNYLERPEEDMLSGSRHISELSRPISITFRDVSFSYQDQQIFSHFNLKIEAGEKLALVGANGAGKTTFVKLLCGFYEPDEGQILLDGIDARQFPKAELYELFSVIFQDIFLPPTKIEESIVLKESKEVEGKRLKAALEKADLLDVFRKKGIYLDPPVDGDSGAEDNPEGHFADFYMGKLYRENGLELSGGQKQRLLLARALYKNGEVLILDEPTAALDPIAESEIYSAYQEYCQDKTSVFISHRLASASFSDKIVLLEKGKILEMGTHQELMARNGAYAEMYRIQSSYYKEEEEAETDGR